VIPARWGSTRLPGKSLIPICGKPLIEWVVEGAQRCGGLDALVVATDDERIRDAVAKLGVEAAMTRPDHPSGTDRVAEAVADTDAEVVVNIQGDEPLVDPALVDRLIQALHDDPRWDMATAAAPLSSHEELWSASVVKVVSDRDGRALYFSRAVIPHVRDGNESAFPSLYRRHLGIYAYRRPFLERLVRTPPCELERAEKLEQLRALHLGASIAVLETSEAGVGVDTPDDVNYVETLLRRLHGD
jgi:3-deoxy-manno-octulosonate cytidylyltransferase (CMP-KDO synthetase)